MTVQCTLYTYSAWSVTEREEGGREGGREGRREERREEGRGRKGGREGKDEEGMYWKLWKAHTAKELKWRGCG